METIIKERTYYTTTGSVRGGCGHKHRSIETALKCRLKDGRDCAHVGGYSDRRIVAIDGDSTRPLTWREDDAITDALIAMGLI